LIGLLLWGVTTNNNILQHLIYARFHKKKKFLLLEKKQKGCRSLVWYYVEDSDFFWITVSLSPSVFFPFKIALSSILVHLVFVVLTNIWNFILFIFLVVGLKKKKKKKNSLKNCKKKRKLIVGQNLAMKCECFFVCVKRVLFDERNSI
jgi:hypothetical protein